MATGAPSRRSTISFRSSGPTTREPVGPPSRPGPWRFWGWAVAYVLATTFSFAPTFSFRRAAARAGEIAPRDVVAPRAVIGPDAAATQRRRIEVSAEVLPVYDWDPAAPDRLAGELRRSFAKARTAAGAGRRKGALAPALRDAFDLPIGDEALLALRELHFSPQIEERLLKIGADLYQAGVVDNRDFLAANRDRGVALRDVRTGREVRRKDLSDAVEYGSHAKGAVATRLAGGPLKGRALTEVAAFLAAALRPNVTFDATETARRRHEASRSVETVLTKVPPGEV